MKYLTHDFPDACGFLGFDVGSLLSNGKVQLLLKAPRHWGARKASSEELQGLWLENKQTGPQPETLGRGNVSNSEFCGPTHFTWPNYMGHTLWLVPLSFTSKLPASHCPPSWAFSISFSLSFSLPHRAFAEDHSLSLCRMRPTLFSIFNHEAFFSSLAQ